jgi:hypothetical protein
MASVSYSPCIRTRICRFRPGFSANLQPRPWLLGCSWGAPLSLGTEVRVAWGLLCLPGLLPSSGTSSMGHGALRGEGQSFFLPLFVWTLTPITISGAMPLVSGSLFGFGPASRAAWGCVTPGSRHSDRVVFLSVRSPTSPYL